MEDGSEISSENSGLTRSAVKTLNSGENLENVDFKTDKGGENALLVESGESSVKGGTVEKKGDDDSEGARIYGTNSAIYAQGDESSLSAENLTISTSAKNGHALFLSDGANSVLDNTTIETTSEYSDGIVVSNGASFYSNNVNITTKSKYSSPVFAGNSGGGMTFMGGEFKSFASNSPAIYSESDVYMENAKISSRNSEAVVAGGNCFVDLRQTVISSTDEQKNDYSQSAQGILISSHTPNNHESRSVFQAENSAIITDHGDHIFVSNADADIFLRHSLFIKNNSDGIFLRAVANPDVQSGDNGGIVNLYTENQDVIGNIEVDSASSINLNLSDSYFKGAIRGEGKKDLTISNETVVVLTEDMHVDSLTNVVEDNQNIYANGHKFFVADKEIAVNNEAAPESIIQYTGEFFENAVWASEHRDTGVPVIVWIGVAVGVAVVIGGLLFVFRNKFMRRSRRPRIEI